MPTQHPRFKITLCQDAADRLEALAAEWSIPVTGLMRCVMERLAEGLQVADLPSSGPVWVRGGPAPAALLGLVRADTAPERNRLDLLGDVLRWYANDGARPAITFRPPDLTEDQVAAELAKMAASAPRSSPPAPLKLQRPAAADREDGATAPPATGGRRRASLSLVLTPPCNTGVTWPQKPPQAPSKPSKARR